MIVSMGCGTAPGQTAAVGDYNTPEPTIPLHVETFATEYAEFFEHMMQQTNTPGAALVIVKDSQIVWMQGYGPRFMGGRDSIDAHTVFRIGSLSKGFAGVLTGIMVQKGYFAWEDRVQSCYPDFRLKDAKQGSRIQLWHLLSHTTGLPYHAFTNLIEQDFSIPRIVRDYFPTAPVCGKEGEFYAYQNAALCVVEEMMLRKTGKTYPQLLSESIFSPAGMHSASCDYAGICATQNKTYPHVATGPHTWRADSISAHYYNAVAAGGVNASIDDMGQWLKVLLGHRPNLVADSTLNRVFKAVVRTDKERQILPQWLPRDAASYALGWRVLQKEADTLMYHSGYVNGFKSEIAFNRRDGIGICVLYNAPTHLGSNCIPAFFDQWKSIQEKGERAKGKSQ